MPAEVSRSRKSTDLFCYPPWWISENGSEKTESISIITKHPYIQDKIGSFFFFFLINCFFFMNTVHTYTCAHTYIYKIADKYCLLPFFLARYLWTSYFWHAHAIADGKYYYYPDTCNSYRKEKIATLVPYGNTECDTPWGKASWIFKCLEVTL